ncbi:MAG: YgiT-type zinc finger protein [Candidatus Sumerlaeota bacterium]|nr:YgiT-type zinc finger protein [Candidatus Sumerlaeota bacterium]
MSLSQAKQTRTFDTFPCPECDKKTIAKVIEDYREEDGFVVKRLKHFKCRSCGARFFDDDAMQHIEDQRRAASARSSKLAA